MVAKIAWLIFARASSTRLPKKCYQLIDGKVILEHIVRDAVSNGVQPDTIFLCTSCEHNNRRLAKIAISLGIKVLYGPEECPTLRIVENENILSGFDYIVRICGDSPLFQSAIVLKAIKLAPKISASPIAITNVINRKFPNGLSIEIYSFSHLMKLLLENRALAENEHLSSILFSSVMREKTILKITPSSSIPLRFMNKYTVDTMLDLENIRDLFRTHQDRDIKEFFNMLDICLEVDSPLDRIS